jgi:hypothetical protein
LVDYKKIEEKSLDKPRQSRPNSKRNRNPSAALNLQCQLRTSLKSQPFLRHLSANLLPRKAVFPGRWFRGTKWKKRRRKKAFLLSRRPP